MRLIQAMLAAGAVLALAGPAATQAPSRTIAVGDGVADGRRLQAYDNAWIYSAQRPGATKAVQGIWTDHFARATVNGRPVWRRLQGMTYVNHQMSSSSSAFDPVSCAPVANEQHHPDGSVLKRRFDGRHVVTERQAKPGGPVTASNFDLPAPVFDFYGGAYGVLLSCLPLAVGLSGTLPAVDETQDAALPATFKVERRERISAGARGERDTYVVLVDTPGQYTQTFWLSKAAPYVIRLRLVWADGHAVAQFDMI